MYDFKTKGHQTIQRSSSLLSNQPTSVQGHHSPREQPACHTSPCRCAGPGSAPARSTFRGRPITSLRMILTSPPRRNHVPSKRPASSPRHGRHTSLRGHRRAAGHAPESEPPREAPDLAAHQPRPLVLRSSASAPESIHHWPLEGFVHSVDCEPAKNGLWWHGLPGRVGFSEIRRFIKMRLEQQD